MRLRLALAEIMHRSIFADHNIHYPEGSLIFLPLRWDYLLLYPDYPLEYEVNVNGVRLCAAKMVTPPE